MITLDSIEYQNASIQIIDAAGDALAIAADGSIAVTDNGASLTVDAVNLDIRDLAFATDKVDASGSAVSITGDVNVTQGTSPWVVSATDLDIRNLVFATDKVDVSGSEVSLDSATLAALENITATISGDVNVTQGTSPWVVSATDLDIRDLTHASDSVKIGDGTDFLAVNTDGSINVQSAEAGYGNWTVITASATTTEGSITALANRLRVEIQNLGTADVYIRQITGVSASNGLKIPKGSSYEQALDAGAAIFYVTGSGTSDLRIAQYAA